MFHGVYFFCHNRQLYVIKAKKEFWKEYITESHTITKLWFQTIAGITLEVNEKRLLGATLRFPQHWDTFNGKTRNRRCINQKIPLFRRNFIPLAVKEGKIIHMRKNVMKEKDSVI
jgi:hypothetical protein